MNNIENYSVLIMYSQEHRKYYACIPEFTINAIIGSGSTREEALEDLKLQHTSESNYPNVPPMIYEHYLFTITQMLNTMRKT